MLVREELIERARTARRESKYLDFKAEWDPSSPGAWCEIVKDIVAFANSGGGILVFGVNNDGSVSGADLKALRSLDIAVLTDKIASYTNCQFSDVEILAVPRDGEKVVAVLVSRVDTPMPFVKPGTYSIGESKQKTAFSQGTVYFRHGAKSEPGTRDDFLAWRERALEEIRGAWLGGIRKVIKAPADHAVTVISAPKGSGLGAAGVGGANSITATVSAGPGALKIVPQNAEEIWPFRQKQLLQEINKLLPGADRINGHDILCINRTFDVLKKKPEFAYKPHSMSSPQYSSAYAEWIVAEFRKDKQFFVKCREKYKTSTSK